MRIQKCYFCSGPIYPGHGMTFVRNDCKIFKFCRPKCHKHFKSKHNPRKLRWTKSYRKLHHKQLSNDTILNFQHKINQPQIYNRTIYTNTIQAMKKISDIRKTRQNRFWTNKTKLSQLQKIHNLNQQLSKHQDLISDTHIRQSIKEKQKQNIILKEQKKFSNKSKRGLFTIDVQ